MRTAAARGGRGSERSAYRIAEKLAKNAGVSVDAWIEEAIAEHAEDLGADPDDLTERERLEAIEQRIERIAGPASETSRRAPEPALPSEGEDDYDRITPREEPRIRRNESRPAADARERGRLEEAIADIDSRAERNQERTARALESLTGLVEARGIERGRLEQAIDKIEQRAARNEQRTAEALQSLQGLVEARGGERERLAQAIAEVEARAERNAERTAQALEKLGGLVEARQSERERLEAAIARVGKRADENEARTARALESLTTLAQPAPAPARAAPLPAPLPPRADAVASRLEDLARRAAKTPEAPRDGDDETFRLVAERLARRRKTRVEPPAEMPAPRRDEAAAASFAAAAPGFAAVAPSFGAVAPSFGAVVADMQRELRRLADKVETLAGSAVGPSALDALRLQTREIETAISAASDKAATVEQMERQVAQLAAQIEKLVGASPAPAEMTQALKALAEARAEIDRNAPLAAFQALERRMEELGARVEAAARRPAVDLAPLEDIARRVETMRVALERQAATRPDAGALSGALQALNDKLDRAFATGSQSAATMTALQGMVGRLEEALQRPTSVSLDARPLEDLARRIEGVRGAVERQGALAPKMDALSAAVGELKQRVERPAAPSAEIARLESALSQIAQGVEAALARSGAVDLRPIEDLARRIEAVRKAVEAQGAPSAQVERLEDALDEIFARLAKVDEAVSRPVAVAFDPAPIEELARRIESVKGVAERGFAPHVARLEAALGDIRARLDKSPATPEIDAALRSLSAKIDEAASRPALDVRPLEDLARRIETVKGVAERGFAPHAARLEAALGDIRARLDKPPTTVSLDPKPIEDLARRIESVRASLEKPPAFSPQAERLESALGAVAEKLERAAPILDGNGINTALAAMTARLEEAFRRPAQVAIDREPIDALAAQLEAMRETVERQSEQFDAGRLESVVRSAVQGMERPAIGAASLMSAIETLAAKIERGPAAFDVGRIEDLLTQFRRERDVEPRNLGALTHAISELAASTGAHGLDGKRVEALLVEIADRVDRPGVEPADIGTLAGAITALGEKLDRNGGASNVSLLEDLTRDVSIRLDALETKIEDRAREASASENWTHLELAVRELTEALGEVRAVADTRALEQEVRLLHEKIDDAADARALPDAFVEQAAVALARDVGARIAATTPDALIGHLADINERLDLIGSTRAAPPALEDALQELTEEMEALRVSRDLVDRGVATLSDMRAEQAQIDRRMDARFSGVQDVLEKVVDRLGRLEREIASAGDMRSAVPPSLRAPTFAAPSRSAMADIPDRGANEGRAAAPGEPDPLALDIAADGRAREGDAKSSAINAHIAAARRAANAAAVETERRELVEDARKATGANGGLAQRAQTLFMQHQRPVLLSAAGALTLLTGVAVLEWRGHAPVRKSELDGPSAVSAPLASLPAPRDAMSTALDNMPTGAIGGEPKVISAPIGAPAKLAAGPKPPASIVAALPAGLNSALALAASSGDIGAEVEIAQRFLDGRSVPRDAKVAADWLQAAADAGSAFAQYRLGALYEKGVGVARDAARARELYTQSAEAGNARAMHNLAVLYAQDGGAGKPDYSSALEWFRKASGYGVRDSQFNLGVLYGRGLGATQDMAQSWLWFSLAARQGDADAAKKRDEVANRMDGRAMTSAKAMLDAFQTKTPDPAVNDPPPVPASAASDAPSGAPKAATSVKG